MRNQVILKDSDLTSILLIVMVAAATAIFLALLFSLEDTRTFQDS
jgi:hypothetical protein